MRLILSISLLAATVVAGEFAKVTVRRPGGAVVAVAALPTSSGNYPLCVTRTGKSHRLIAFGLDGVQFYHGALSAEPLGMQTIGASVYLAQRANDTVSTLQIRMIRGAVAPFVGGTEQLNAMPRAQYLGMTHRGSSPLLVFGHDRGVFCVTPGKYRNRVALRRSHRFLDATGKFDADNDRLSDLILLTNGTRLVRLEAADRNDTLHAHQDYPYRTEGVVATSIAAAGNQVWIGGARNGKATLLLFDPNAAPTIHKIKDIFKDNKSGGRDPSGQYELGRGTITGIEILGKQHLVVTGTRAGRPWIALLARTGGVTVVDEALLSGTKITAFCVNEKRIGWTVAAATDDGLLHVLRSAGDRKAPRDAPTPRPTPEPRPDPKPDPKPDPRTGTGDGHIATAAYFPRVEADTRRGLDTVLYLLYVGARPARITVRYYDAKGQLVAQQPVTARRNTRTKLSLAEALRGKRGMDLDGWAVVTGVDKRDLILEGLLYRGTATPESLRPFWR